MKKAIFFSILVHLLVGYFLSTLQTTKEREAFFPKPIPPKYISPNSLAVRTLDSQEMKQIVESAAAKNVISSHEKTKYLGERTQRVEKQSRANRFGSVEGSEKLGTEKSSRQKKTENFELIKGLWKLPEELNTEVKGKTVLSGSMDALDDTIAVSNQTLLNTDEYLYASFFNRIKREIGPRWEPMVQDYLQTTLVLIDGVYSTRCVFWLNREGVLQKVEVKESSGVKELDNIAVNSIRNLAFFPNPPDTLLDSEGMHRVELGFLVSYSKKKYQFDYLPDPRFRR